MAVPANTPVTIRVASPTTSPYGPILLRPEGTTATTEGSKPTPAIVAIEAVFSVVTGFLTVVVSRQPVLTISEATGLPSAPLLSRGSPN